MQVHILLLGMRRTRLALIENNWCHGMKNREELNFDDIIKAVVESTTDKQSNETIGRDLIRILSLEYTYNAICYSVSDNTSDIDSDKHTEIDFNNRHFCSRLKEKYNGIKFEQIILDYFWSPPGEWQRTHWKKNSLVSLYPI